MTEPELAGGHVFLVMRNSFEGFWKSRLTPVKVTQSYPRVIDADCIVVHALITVPAAAFTALEAGDVYAEAAPREAYVEVS